ncbi:C40 family peptidase [Aliterella atlantica]|uniref:Glycoside hydrolase n=1 Tax=Aliterella atlantica CENA595 TaxID=1618023 RepID=A0A0D8ZWL2_9CYAN|nr:C40 family peptidase [Aliterella atlantica]KJH72819.1 glycoside hydrolase [Aliterella atlantica CENA595]
MVSLAQLQQNLAAEYLCCTNLNLYDNSNCSTLATQAARGRHLQVIGQENRAVKVRLCEDDYPGWLLADDLAFLQVADRVYQANSVTEAEIQARIPAAVEFTKLAMQQPNYYLWGGTVGPNYDCSGLMQAAFAAVGVWLPRDAYQQEVFCLAVAVEDLQVGDLVFFGSEHKATHVGLYLGEGFYIHSSGQKIGRDGIGIDLLSELGEEVGRSYYRQLRGCGRVVGSYVSEACA